MFWIRDHSQWVEKVEEMVARISKILVILERIKEHHSLYIDSKRNAERSRSSCTDHVFIIDFDKALGGMNKMFIWNDIPKRGIPKKHSYH